MDNEPPNPIVQRLSKLETLWMQFAAQPQARICRWLLKEDEVRMLYGFVEASYREEANVQAAFINLQAEFPDMATYSDALAQELTAFIAQERDALAQEGVHLQWTAEAKPYYERNAAATFLKNFAAFAHEFYPGGLVVAFLDPANKPKDLEKWLFEALASGIPDHIRIMVYDYDEYKLYDRLAKHAPQQVITLTPELDMPAAMRQLAASGNPTAPDVRFRRAFLDLSQAVTKLDMDGVKRLFNAPQSIAREQNWPHLEAAVFNLAGTAYAGSKNYPEAMTHYQTAQQIGQSMHAQGNPLGLTVAMQSLFYKGAIHVAQKDHRSAAATYHEAGDCAETLGDAFHVMEARRMECFCSQMSGNGQGAWAAGRQGLAAAEQIDPNIRANSTLPYLGKMMLELAYNTGRKAEYADIGQRMNTLCGPDWEKKIETYKTA